jgi:GT2 family glycosyltransferase
MSTQVASFTVAIITFNVIDKLRVCIDSVLDELPEVPVRVWDNGSTDGTKEMMESEYKNIRYTYSKENLYFAQGCNELIKQCTTKYALLMNADIKLIDSSVNQIVEYMEIHGDVIATSPSVRDHNIVRHMSSGTITPLWCIVRDSFIGVPFRNSIGYRTVMGSQTDPYSIFNADKITNCCCMIRCNQFTTIGGFSTHQLLYWTEEEFALRVKNMRMKQSVYGKSIVEHDHGSSTKKLPSSLVRAIYVHDRMAYMIAMFGCLKALFVEIALLRPKIWKSFQEYYWYLLWRKKIDTIKKSIQMHQL